MGNFWKYRGSQLGQYCTLFAMLLISSMNGSAQNCPELSRYFNIDSATKMTEHAGVYGGGSSVQYEIFLTVKKKHLKYFDSVWAQGTSSLVILKVPKIENLCARDWKFSKNRKLILTFNLSYNIDPAAEAAGSKVYKKPVDCPQELIMRYKYKRKIHYIALSKFTKLSAINLP